MLGRSPRHPQIWSGASSVAAKQLLFFWTTCRAITIYRQFIITKAAPVKASRVQGRRNRTRRSSLLEKEARRSARHIERLECAEQENVRPPGVSRDHALPQSQKWVCESCPVVRGNRNRERRCNRRRSPLGLSLRAF